MHAVGRCGRHAVLAVFFALLLAGCRGSISEKPPIHPNPNMDAQEKYKPQAESHFFADGSTMRLPVEGTVARGALDEDAVWHTGKGSNGEYATLPFEVTEEVRTRGRERYGIFCKPCHGELGNGRGKIMEYKYPIPPTSYFEPRLMEARDGYFFEVITQGVRTMPSYRAQIPVRDRWHIVAHVRALQERALPDSLKGISGSQQQAVVP